MKETILFKTSLRQWLFQGLDCKHDFITDVEV